MQAQTVFKIADYKMFPPEMEILDIKPDIVEWGVGGSYLLLDKINHQLVSVGSLRGMQMVGGFGRKAVSFSEPIWVCLLYTSPSPRDGLLSRMPSSA